MSPIVGTADRLGRFRLLRKLGAGGMGIVYEAQEDEGTLPVALKTLGGLGSEGLLRFKGEFRNVQAIAHQNLVTLYELGAAGSIWFFTMELLEGVDLKAYLAAHGNGGRVDTAQLKVLFGHIVDGLEALHAAGVRHLDMKPSNVMVTNAGRVVLLDFGLALVAGDVSISNERGVFGTLPYMPPEQATGSALTDASDWYAMGAMLFEALVGRPPFEGPPAAVVMHKCNSEPPRAAGLAPDVPKDLSDLAHCLLARDPTARPGIEDIRHVLGTRPLRPPPRSTTLIGRDQELRELARAFDAHRRRGATLVHVRGPSGVGKSAFLEVAAAQLAKSGATVVRARCHEFESIPYKGFDALIDRAFRLVRRLPNDARAALGNETLAAAAQMFPVLEGLLQTAPAPQRVANDAERRDLASAGVRQLFAAFAARGPLCVVLDDAQWGDLDSARLLEFLLATQEQVCAFYVLAYRADEASYSSFLRHLTAPNPHRSWHEAYVDLAPLAAADATKLARRLLPDDSPMADAVAREAEGIPFFIEQLALHIQEARSERTRTTTVASLVGTRLRSLPAEARTLLGTVAAAGRPLRQAVVLDAAQPRDAVGVLSLLCRQSMVRIEGLGPSALVQTYHDRIREAVVASMEADELRRVHAALAAALERDPEARLHTIAAHLHAAGQMRRAADFAHRAARDAEAALAFDLAAELYGNALAWGGAGHPDAARWRMGRASALHRAGRCREAGPAFLDAAEGETDPQARRELKRLGVEALLSAGAVEKALTVLRPLLADAGVPFPTSPRAAAFGLMIAALNARRRIRRVGTLAGGSTNAAARARAELCWSVGKGLLNVAPVEGMVTVIRGLHYALDAGDGQAVVPGLCVAGSGYAPFLGKRSRDFLTRGDMLANASGSSYLRGLMHVGHSVRSLITGHWAEGLQHADAAHALLGRDGLPAAWEIAVAHTLAVSMLEHRGHLLEMAVRARDAIRASKGRGDECTVVMISGALGYACAAGADIEGLGAIIDDMARIVSRWTVKYGMWDFYLLRLRVLRDFRLGHAAEAHQRVEAAWPKIVESHFLNLGILRPAALQLRAATQLAEYRRTGCQDRHLRRQIRATAAQAQRTPRVDGPALADVTQAALCEMAGDTTASEAGLRRAEARYRAGHMHVFALMVERALAQRSCGARELQQIEADLAETGVLAPATWAPFHIAGSDNM